MTVKEQQPLSLEQLMSQRERLVHIRDKRINLQSKLETIAGTTLPVFYSVDQRRRVAQAKTLGNKTDKSINIINNKLEAISEQIIDLSPEVQESLITQARDWKLNLLRHKKVLRYSDHLTKGEIQTYTLKYEELQKLADTDRELKRGLELLAQRREKERLAQESAVAPVAPKETKETEKQVAAIKIDPETRIVEIPGKEPVKLDKRSFLVFNILYNNLNQEVNSVEVTRMLKAAGYNSEVGAAIYGLRAILETNPKKPELVTRKILGPHSFSYKLNIAQPETTIAKEAKATAETEIADQIRVEDKIESTSQAEKQKSAKYLIDLPNGNQYPTNSEFEKTCVEGLLAASIEFPVTLKELTEEVYKGLLSTGEINYNTANHRFYQVLRTVRNKLKGLGLDIENINKGSSRPAAYYLEKFPKISPEIPIIETSQQPLEGLETVPAEDAPVEYSPLEDKKRTDRETRILKTLVDSLVSSGSENVWLEHILDVPRKELTSKGEHNIKQISQEFRDLLASAHNKLREEHDTPLIVNQWTQDDWDLWSKLLILNTRLKTRDDQHLIQKLLGKVKKAEHNLLAETRQIEEYITSGK